MKDLGNCLMCADILVAIGMIFQFVQKCELNIHVTNCENDL